MSSVAVGVRVVERNPVLELGVAALLRGAAGIELVADRAARPVREGGGEEKGDGEEEEGEAAVVVVGLEGPRGLAEVERLAAVHKVVVLAPEESPALLVRALRAGAHAVLAHGHFGAAELAEAVAAAAQSRGYLSPPVATALVDWLHGGSPEAPGRTRGFGHSLTPREAEVMELIARGWSNRRIASELYISEKTVKNHVHQIYRRLKADDREHAVARWRVLGPARS
ncbi:DNA-binding NarL/FixJ family response regulator [Actinocorallia herbida]|uniref:DNA-binding NarL/FixJ family response regulator n=1 Tax=Actinocorallia herbida TaxID=58109 RepID=A0A3N1D8N4_9ACTN|nr:response regulator transcription factor [Actinocorallia herbida]ROO89894.1 DNA-binding NarL/FixJ family response regulator [Actinocorallia herbida]